MTISEYKKLTAQVFNREISPEEYRKLVGMIKKDGKWTYTRKPTVKKDKQTFIEPNLDEFILFFKENGYRIDNAENVYKGYKEAGWKDSNGKPIINWKQKVRFVWFKPDNKIKQGLIKTL